MIINESLINEYKLVNPENTGFNYPEKSFRLFFWILRSEASRAKTQPKEVGVRPGKNEAAIGSVGRE